MIDIETRAKAKALGIVARTGKNFTGLEVQGNEKIYFKPKSIELSRVEVDNGTFAELADIFTEQWPKAHDFSRWDEGTLDS